MRRLFDLGRLEREVPEARAEHGVAAPEAHRLGKEPVVGVVLQVLRCA